MRVAATDTYLQCHLGSTTVAKQAKGLWIAAADREHQVVRVLVGLDVVRELTAPRWVRDDACPEPVWLFACLPLLAALAALALDRRNIMVVIQKQSKILALHHPAPRLLEMGHEGVAPGDHGKEDLGAFVALRHKVRG
jgi:hypothetical protein